MLAENLGDSYKPLQQYSLQGEMSSRLNEEGEGGNCEFAEVDVGK